MLINDKVVDTIIRNYFDKYDECVAVPRKISMKVENINFKKRRKFNIIQFIKRMIIIVLSLLTATGGLVFAKKYIFQNNSKYGLGNGIDTATQYGYIYEPKLNLQTSMIESPDIVIENATMNISLNDFLMDDQNISSTFKLELDQSLLEKIDLSSIKSIEIKDLLVTDENNKILYCLDSNTFSEFCNTNNLNYDFLNFNDNYYNSGVNIRLNKIEKSNLIDLNYNIYIDNLYKDYPKSKKINYTFSKLILYQNEDEKIVELNGRWCFELDVPEVMYNRNSINYEVVSCPDNIKVTKASASETGFEFGCIIDGISKNVSNGKYEEFVMKYQNNEISEEEFKEMTKAIESRNIQPIETNFNEKYYEYTGDTIEDCTHIETENGKCYIRSTNPGRKQNCNFISDNKVDFYETFDLTQYDVTDKISVIVVWYNDNYEQEKALIHLNRR